VFRSWMEPVGTKIKLFFYWKDESKLSNFIIVHKDPPSRFRIHDLPLGGCCLWPLDQRLILGIKIKLNRSVPIKTRISNTHKTKRRNSVKTIWFELDQLIAGVWSIPILSNWSQSHIIFIFVADTDHSNKATNNTEIRELYK
jgi:hypothetical protein